MPQLRHLRHSRRWHQTPVLTLLAAGCLLAAPVAVSGQQLDEEPSARRPAAQERQERSVQKEEATKPENSPREESQREESQRREGQRRGVQDQDVQDQDAENQASRADARNQRKPQRQGRGQGQDQGQGQDVSDYRPDESPELGIVVMASPSGAVFVMDTVMGSPADRAGIAHGDYLTAINDQKITSPAQLRRLVSKLEPGKEVSLNIWRDGEEMTQNVVVASQSDRLPKSEKAWLGVMLSPSSEGGLQIERVINGSPADEAGLQNGDRIVAYDGQEISDVQSFIQRVEDMGPDSELNLTIDRDGEQQEVTATLAHLDSAPMRFLREATGMSGDPLEEPLVPFGSGPNMIDELVDELRQRVRALEEEVNQRYQGRSQQQRQQRGDEATPSNRTERKRNQDPKQSDGNRDEASNQDAGGDQEFDVSSLENRAEQVTKVLAQRRRGDDGRGNDGRGNRGRGGRDWDDRDRDWYDRGDRDWYDRDRNDRDWRRRGYRYGYRDWDRSRDSRYRDWRSSRYPYRFPLYQSPRYGNWYFRWGGVPYYHRGYGFGRSDFRIGRFGNFWY